MDRKLPASFSDNRRNGNSRDSSHHHHHNHHDEKVAIMNRVHQESRLRDEKLALVSAMGCGDDAIWTPSVENPRLQAKLTCVRGRCLESAPFEVEPDYRDEPPPHRDDFPSPLSGIDDRLGLVGDERKDRFCRRWGAGACVGLALVIAGISGVALFAARGGGIAVPGPSGGGEADAGGDDDSSSGPPPSCILDLEKLSKCRLHGLFVPDCAKATFRSFKSIYLSHGADPLNFETLHECDAAHKALVALAVADANYNLEDDVGFYFGMANLYFSLGGDQWRDKTNWLEGRSPCNWFGANCTASPGYLEIDWTRNNVKGQLPSQISLLSNLRRFNVGKNQIEGSIPSEVGLLYNLEELELHDSLLDGRIPSELGNCEMLRHLNLEDTGLTGALPVELGNLGHLVNLTMSGSFISGSLPSELGNLSSLQQMVLKNFHRLTGTIPSSIFQMEQLQTLHIEGAVMDKAPFPVTIGSMTNLVSLSLKNVDLTGTIPTQIAMLHQNFESLFLHFNSFGSTLPSELGLLTELLTINISYNDLVGTLPSELGRLTKLTTMMMVNNKFTGTVPSELGALTMLTDLHLTLNALTGTLPSEICALDIFNIAYDACGDDTQSSISSSACVADGFCET